MATPRRRTRDDEVDDIPTEDNESLISLATLPLDDIDAEKVPVLINTPKVEREYRRISNKLGTSFAQNLTTDELLKYLADNGITVYPMEKVKAYLNKKLTDFPKSRSRSDYNDQYSSRSNRWTWNWLALRDIDLLRNSGNFSKLYPCGSKPIPLEVLMTAEKMVDEFGPSRIHFYVSEFVKAERPTPRNVDPFLAVCAHPDKLFVIERWDEPAFRM